MKTHNELEAEREEEAAAAAQREEIERVFAEKQAAEAVRVSTGLRSFFATPICAVFVDCLRVL